MELKYLGTAAMTILVFVIIASMGARVLQGIKSSQFDTAAVVNESFTSSTAPAGTSLAYRHLLTVGSVYNTTISGGKLVPTSNYTYNLEAGTLTIRGDNHSKAFNNTLLNVSYTRRVDTSSYNASASGENSLQELVGWTPTIALLLAAAIVISIIVMYFKTRLD